MKILITGVHGFVGSNLLSYWMREGAQAHTLYGLDIIAPEKAGLAKTFSWDDLDAGRVPEVDAVIHLAGKAHDTKNEAAADVYFKVNTGLTQKIFDYFCARPGIRKFVFFSTAKAAADRVDGVLTEDVVPAPVGPYGESKIAAERHILDCMRQNPSQFEGRSVYILRPCMIHGPGNKGNLNLLYNVVRRGIPWPLGAFENRRTFTSIDNLTFVISGILSKPIESGIYNMADDKALSTNELIKTMCSAMGKKAHIWRINRSFINFIAKTGDFLHLPLNTFRLGKLTENYVVSNTKIKMALGIEKMPFDARDGLTKTIQSFQNHE